MDRPVVLPWTCHQTGACCKGPFLAMTYAERRELEAVAGSRRLVWRYDPQPSFTRLETAGGCPFLTGDGKCSAYDVRPYNCRRFACLRPSADETFDASGPLGCANLSDRLSASDTARDWFMAMQRDAQQWAVTHGWKESVR